MSTEELICEIAFRNFLEKGYEATNLRKVSDEVGIKAASIYFYYKTKKDIFVSIYNKICEEQLSLILKVIHKNKELTAKKQLYFILKNKINACINYSAKYRFLLRYQLFPAEELLSETRELYQKWLQEEFILYEPIIAACIEDHQDVIKINTNLFFKQYKRFENHQIYEMIISGLATSDEEIEIQWKNFWNYCLT